jgi:hypothetical protein
MVTFIVGGGRGWNEQPPRQFAGHGKVSQEMNGQFSFLHLPSLTFFRPFLSSLLPECIALSPFTFLPSSPFLHLPSFNSLPSSSLPSSSLLYEKVVLGQGSFLVYDFFFLPPSLLSLTRRTDQ